MSTSHRPPAFSPREAAELARRLYGVEGTPHPLPADRDQNVKLETAAGEAWVLKISQSGEDPEILACQDQVMERLTGAGLPFRFPRVRPTTTGERIGEVTAEEGAVHLVRLVEWIPGVPLARARPHTPDLLREVGKLMGSVGRVLRDYHHPAAHRDFDWDLRRAGEVVDRDLEQVEGQDRRDLVSRFRALFQERVEPEAGRLPLSVIHGDGNDYNILVGVSEGEGASGGRCPDPLRPLRVIGLLDFGDMVRSWRVGEPAVAAAYAMLGREDPLAAAAWVLEGHHGVLPMEEAEISAFFPLVCMRLAVSVVQSARRKGEEPDDGYITISEAPAWRALERLTEVDPDLAHYTFRAACGLPPCPATEGVVRWLEENADAAGPVLEGAAGSEGEGVAPEVVDLSVSSSEVEGGASAPPGSRSLPGAPASLRVARHDEVRWITDPALRAPADPVPEWRTVHLGLDLFAPPGTRVLAPLEGVVEEVGEGALLLRHQVEGGEVVFRTRYAGLNPRPPEPGGEAPDDGSETRVLSAGTRVEKGDPLGAVADPPAGHGGAGIGRPGDGRAGAPRLHFQLVVDPVGRGAAFPALVRPSEREVWRSLSPDPSLLLGLPGVAVSEEEEAETAELLEARRRLLGPSLTVDYRRPLHIVRGWMQHLYDAQGQPHLDGRNNVAHVGHEHPRVVEALRRQAAVLNTNTRYLHRELVGLAERLAATFPEPLRVCYFVCTGSEANELALRMARTHTGRRDVAVLEGAYHGNTSSLVEMSPYKYRGPGGQGPPPWVHETPLPDPYRGRYRIPDVSEEELGARYAGHVKEVLEEAAARGRPVAALFAEVLPGCAGQIVPPPGYLARAFRHVREAGGVAVADEVQTGLGRVGTHFWAFQAQDALPDIVTVGKPLGNGHPVAAVVTTPEIAASFATGMEYFNSFGGNPVSAAVARTVLEVVVEEDLQARARRVGDHLTEGLRDLMDRHPLVGDVRGPGLFVGVELVLDREDRTPAGAHAAYVVERLREHRILVGRDGPYGNVLKIKPPLVFSTGDADRLVETLDRVLQEDPVRVG